jgi:hypothetical protein
MKKNIQLFVILVVSVLCAGFTACSEDDDSFAKNIAADYTGVLTGTDLTNPTAPVAATISIKEKSDDKVDLTFTQTILDMPFDIACEATVTQTNGIYHLNGTTAVNLSEIPFPIPVAITGDVLVVAGVKTATLNIVVGTEASQAVMPVFPLTVTFVGANKK